MQIFAEEVMPVLARACSGKVELPVARPRSGHLNPAPASVSEETMASKQTEELNKLYREWVAALKGNPEMPLDELRHMFEQWPRITGEPGGVDYIETDAGGVPAMWAAPKNCAQDSP